MTHSEWECSFKRITEKSGLVFLELEERSRIGGHSSVVNSVSVYEFNAAGKLRHLDIYLQMPMPDPKMLASYAGVRVSEYLGETYGPGWDAFQSLLRERRDSGALEGLMLSK